MQKTSRRKFLQQAGLASAVGLIATSIVPQSVSAGPIVTVGIDIGRKKFNCEKFGVCGITVGVGAAAIAGKTVPGTAQIEGNKLLLKTLRPLRNRETTIPIDEDIILSPALCKALGVRSASVLAGEYQLTHERRGTSTSLNLKLG